MRITNVPAAVERALRFAEIGDIVSSDAWIHGPYVVERNNNVVMVLQGIGANRNIRMRFKTLDHPVLIQQGG
jgi:hypothetical protein